MGDLDEEVGALFGMTDRRVGDEMENLGRGAFGGVCPGVHSFGNGRRRHFDVVVTREGCF